MENVQNYCYVGIDIAQSSFEVDLGEKVISLENNVRIEALKGQLPVSACCVMEATGAYHCRLAYFLYQQNIPLCVVNPLSAKHFAAAQRQRAKTDSSDARMLSGYGQSLRPSLWQPLEEDIVQLRQILGLIEQYIKQRTALKNQIHALELNPQYSPKVLDSLSEMLVQVQVQIDMLEAESQKTIQSHYQTMSENLQSIPGIGIKTATVLIALSQGFKLFEHYKQVIAYVGLAPRIFQSGKSLKIKGHICKLGTGHLRSLLFICAKSAIRWNPACKALFERLRAKGKAYKLALIAVANKLIKQAFAIAKSGKKFQVDYVKNI